MPPVRSYIVKDLGEHQTHDSKGLWGLYEMSDGRRQFRRLDQVLGKDDLLAMLRMLEEAQCE